MLDSPLADEQAYLDRLHDQLDRRREELSRLLAETVRSSTGTAQSRVEQGVQLERLNRQLAATQAAEQGLCFGRLDTTGDVPRYLGRIGLQGDPQDEEPLLLDWRAPAARPFYTATWANPQGVRRRRHLHTSGRTLLRVDDELVDGTVPPPEGTELTGEAALLTALTAERSGRMREAVATLQAEQDRVIRSPHTGALTVQGAPGTGKTVVALHRAAYLLYTVPQLQDRGVLVVGPNAVFRRYISQVLPSLGETSVLLAALGELYPGHVATGTEPVAVAELKGRPALAELLGAAVRLRQAAVTDPVRVSVGGEWLTLDAHWLTTAADQARASHLPHNLARPLFCRAVVAELARQLSRVIADIEARFEEELADRIDSPALDRAAAEDLAAVFGADVTPRDPDAQQLDELYDAEQHWLAELPNDPAVQRLLHDLWPILTPEQLLTELFADPAAIERAAHAASLDATECARLRRPAAGRWTTADVPLLDEAAELLGFDSRAQERRRAAEREQERDYAQGVLDIAAGTGTDADDDPDADDRRETLNAADLVDAERLASWHRTTDLATVAERAAADRAWTFGHVIVDEAQELSWMAWRMLVRRCPSRSFTIVGDIAQTVSAVGASSWAQALEPHFGSRWRLERLTVNYRTPGEIMAAAEPIRTAICPGEAAAKAVRSAGPVRHRQVPFEDLPRQLADLASQEAVWVGRGRVAVITAADAVAAVGAAVRQRVPAASVGPELDLACPVVVLSARQAKGLEFDSVLLADPAAILADSAQGPADLYVAMTRATRRLHILHEGPLPSLLSSVPVSASLGPS